MTLLKKLQWQAEYSAYRLLEKLFQLFSLPQICRIGRRFGDLAWKTIPSRRHAVLKNIRTAFADEMSLEEQQTLTREIFRTASANLMASIRTAQLNRDELASVLEIEHRELLNEAIALKKGVIVLVPHMGNWEILAQVSFLLSEGITGGTHYRPLNNIYLDSLIKRRRQRQGTKLFSKRSSPHTLASFLRKNGVLGILADQRVPKGGHFTEYYGRFSPCSPLPEVLATRTEASILALSLGTTDLGKWKLTFHSVETPDTPACMKAMEAATRTSPADVFWLQERWRLDRVKPYHAPNKPHPCADASSSKKPYRIAYHLEKPTLPEQTRPDLTFVQGPEALFNADASLSELQEALLSFSQDSSLPLDAVHHPSASPVLHKACKSLAIQLFTFPIS